MASGGWRACITRSRKWNPHPFPGKRKSLRPCGVRPSRHRSAPEVSPGNHSSLECVEHTGPTAVHTFGEDMKMYRPATLVLTASLLSIPHARAQNAEFTETLKKN